MNYRDCITNIDDGSYIIVIDKNDLIDNIIKKITDIHLINYENHHFIRVEGNIKISHVREIKKNLNLKSFGTKKLLAIANSENLTIEASNSLLKILEEPPKNTIILLFVQNIHKILSTINSRCQKIYIRSEKSYLCDDKYIKLYDKIINCKYLYDKIKIINLIIKNKIDIVRMLKEWMMYLRKFQGNEQYKRIKTINDFLKKYKIGINKKLLLENIVINL